MLHSGAQSTKLSTQAPSPSWLSPRRVINWNHLRLSGAMYFVHDVHCSEIEKALDICSDRAKQTINICTQVEGRLTTNIRYINRPETLISFASTPNPGLCVQCVVVS